MKKAYKRAFYCTRESWHGSYFENIGFDGDSLIMENRLLGRAVICKSSVDSGENGFEWGRVTFDASLSGDDFLRVRCLCGDSESPNGTPDGYTLDEYLGSGKCEVRQLMTIFGGDSSVGDDFLVNGSGRYLWIMAELVSTGARSPCVRSMAVHFPSDHMIDYLPAVYRSSGDFTKRFLSVFDSVSSDMDLAIDSLPGRFDYEKAGGEQLGLLSHWVGTDIYRCPENGREAQTECIRDAVSDFADMNSVTGIKRTVKRLCGREPLIIENADVNPNNPSCTNPAAYMRLYGDNPFKFYVLLDDDTFSGRDELDRFIEAMEDKKPAHTEMETVLLKKSVTLDRHTYLGINTYISRYTPAAADNSALNYDNVVGFDGGIKLDDTGHNGTQIQK